MKKIWTKCEQHLKMQCESLSPKARRKLVMGISVIYGLCALGMIAQWVLVSKENSLKVPLETIQKQKITTDSIFIK